MDVKNMWIEILQCLFDNAINPHLQLLKVKQVCRKLNELGNIAWQTKTSTAECYKTADIFMYKVAQTKNCSRELFVFALDIYFKWDETGKFIKEDIVWLYRENFWRGLVKKAVFAENYDVAKYCTVRNVTKSFWYPVSVDSFSHTIFTLGEKLNVQGLLDYLNWTSVRAISFHGKEFIFIKAVLDNRKLKWKLDNVKEFCDLLCAGYHYSGYDNWFVTRYVKKVLRYFISTAGYVDTLLEYFNEKKEKKLLSAAACILLEAMDLNYVDPKLIINENSKIFWLFNAIGMSEIRYIRLLRDICETYLQDSKFPDLDVFLILEVNALPYVAIKANWDFTGAKDSDFSVDAEAEILLDITDDEDIMLDSSSDDDSSDD